MGLPEVEGLDDIVTKENVERMRRLERQKRTSKKPAVYVQTEAATGTAEEVTYSSKFCTWISTLPVVK